MIDKSRLARWLWCQSLWFCWWNDDQAKAISYVFDILRGRLIRRVKHVRRNGQLIFVSFRAVISSTQKCFKRFPNSFTAVKITMKTKVAHFWDMVNRSAVTLDKFIFWPKVPPPQKKRGIWHRKSQKFPGVTRPTSQLEGRPPPNSNPSTAIRRARGRQRPRCSDLSLGNSVLSRRLFGGNPPNYKFPQKFRSKNFFRLLRSRTFLYTITF